MILLIDNYDSFSYNLYQLIAAIRADIRVVRNDELTVAEIEKLMPECIVISPGPGRPENAGICIEAIQKLSGKIPILGVCLGHQAICEAFGGKITYAKTLMHGKSSMITVDTKAELFYGMDSQIRVARYHSLAADSESLPECLKVTAVAEDGEIMAVEHRNYPVTGLQFHPESILTPQGKQILENYIRKIEKKTNGKQEDGTMMKEAIISLSKKEDLSYETAQAVMDEIMSGKASQIQMSAYLTALAMKGETIDEITASAAGMRAHCIKLLHDEEVLEIVGTGGDKSNSFNISTTASLVISSAGVPVAKHGNRAASSKCGAADVLEALGVNITAAPEKSTELLRKINICFLFAQNYHIAMKYVAPVRRELGIRTVFNILGPLSNPAGARMQVMGVYEEALVEPLARVLTKLGVKSAMVVYGQDKLDEISMSAPTTVCEVRDGEYRSYEITPEEFGFTRCTKEELVGGTPAENAAITRSILEGVRGPKRDAVVMNAGAGLYVAGKTKTLEEGIRLAEQLIDSGAAKKRLEEFVQYSNE